VNRPRYSFNQKAAIITLAITALSGLTLLYFNLISPSGANIDEILFLGTLTVMLTALVPLYLLKVNWSWGAGIVVYLGLYLGAVVEVLDGVLFFSASIYNISVIALYIVATAGILFSFKSLRELPQRQWKKTTLAVTGTILATVIMGAVVLPNFSNRISWYMGETSIGNIRNDIERLGSLKEKIGYLKNSERMPTFVAGVVVNERLIWNLGWGASSVETIYPIDSITKTFTATAVLQLYERGLLGLDDDINQYLPFSLRHPDYPNRPITPRMLLSHQSGLGHRTDLFDDYTLGEEFLDYMIEHKFRTITKSVQNVPKEEFFEKLVNPDGEYYTPDVWTSNQPGTAYSYSNIGFDILALVVETVTGQEYTDYLQENILDPLNMTSTVFSIHEHPERQAVPWERMYGVLSKTMVELPLYGRTMFGAGGIRSTVKDLSQFMIAHMNNGANGNVQLLQPETAELMQSIQVEVTPGQGDAFQVAEGLGLSILTDETWRYWNHEYNMHGATGHGGSNPGSTSAMWFMEDENGSYGIITMTNHKQTQKPDNGVFTISVLFTIQELLMQEAYDRHLELEFELALDLPF
jgi:CubicO group peptidase (beta-lactamase class C family)